MLTLFFCALSAFFLGLPAALLLLLLLLTTTLFLFVLPTSLLCSPVLFLPLPHPGRVDRPDHLIDCPLAGYEAVDPMEIGKSDPQAAPRLRVFDAERDDELAALARDRDLAADVFVPITMLGEDQQQRPARLDRFGGLVVERLARVHVARRDPAWNAAPLQLVDYFERGQPVVPDMADEQKEIGIGHRPGQLLKPSTATTVHTAARKLHSGLLSDRLNLHPFKFRWL